MMTSEFARHFPESRCSVFSCCFRSLRCSKNESLLFHLCGDSISHWQCGGRGPALTFCWRKLSKITLYFVEWGECARRLLCWAGPRRCSARGSEASSPDWQGAGESDFSPSAERQRCCFSPICSLTGKKIGKLKIPHSPTATFIHILQCCFVSCIMQFSDIIPVSHFLSCFISEWLFWLCQCFYVKIAILQTTVNQSTQMAQATVPIFRDICYLCGLHSKCIHSFWFLSEALVWSAGTSCLLSHYEPNLDGCISWSQWES